MTVDECHPGQGSRHPQSTIATAVLAPEGRIATAAVEVIGTKGYRAASISDIVAAAGVSRAEFDARYASKEDCYLDVYESMRRQFLETLGTAFVEGDGWLDGLRHAALEAHSYFREDPVRGRFTVVEPLNAGDRIAAALDEALDLLVELIHAGRFELDDPGSVPRSAAETAVGSIWSALVGQLRDGARFSDGELIPLLLYFAIIPYKGAEVARQEFDRMRSQEFSDD